MDGAVQSAVLCQPRTPCGNQGAGTTSSWLRASASMAARTASISGSAGSKPSLFSLAGSPQKREKVLLPLRAMSNSRWIGTPDSSISRRVTSPRFQPRPVQILTTSPEAPATPPSPISKRAASPASMKSRSTSRSPVRSTPPVSPIPATWRAKLPSASVADIPGPMGLKIRATTTGNPREAAARPCKVWAYLLMP